MFHVVQHPASGFLYLGNGSGLLEYDGSAWRLISSRNEGSVPVVLVDARGAVWMGGANGIAVLRPDARGELQAVDVTEQLPAAERLFGRLYVAAAAPHGVFFASPSHLVYLGNDGSARTWPSGPTHFNGLCWLDGALYASRGAAGLARLEHGALVNVARAPRNPNPAIADTLRVFAARATRGHDALLLTNLGPMRWAGPATPIEPLSDTSMSEFARENASTATFLPDGRFAFSCQGRGVVILDARGNVSSRLDATRGLPGGKIEHLAADDQGGLWLARTNGLARLQIDSRYATHRAFDGARAFLRHRGRLYVACDVGVAWRDDTTGRAQPVAGLPTSPNSFFSVGERIFCTGQFLREITPDDRAIVVLPLSFNAVAPLPGAPGRFVGASVAGLRLLHLDGHDWRDEGLVPGVRGSVRHVLGERENSVWALGYAGGGSWRVDFRAGTSAAATAEYFDAARGLPFSRGRDLARFFTLGGETLTARAGTLLRYDHAAGHFVPEDRLENGPSFGPLAIAPGEKEEQWWLVSSPAPQLVHVVPTAANRWRADSLPIGPLHGYFPYSLYYDTPTRTIWISTRGAPISVDPDWRPAQPPPPFRALIRRLATASGELLWADAGSRDVPPLPRRPAVRLQSHENSLRIEFAAPAFMPNHRGAARTLFRTRLVGLDETWTSWSPTPWREFTDLGYRDFEFQVQARDIEGRESTVGTLALAIAPPLWLARPMLAGYGALALLAIVGLFRLRTRALRRRNDHLEAVVAFRTAELERLRRLEMDEKISARLAGEKARLEVLRYQLNPHFLFNALNSIYTLVWSHSRPAGDVVRRLAEFCRMTLTRGGSDSATLAEEFAMLRAYLDLEKIRWEENLQVEFSLAASLEPVLLPPFLLLPLVENAVKYGGHTSPDLLRIRVTARPETDGAIAIEVANTGTWVEPGSVAGIASTNIGLENLRQRLTRHFPGAHEFSIEARDGWVVMRLRLNVGAASAAHAPP